MEIELKKTLIALFATASVFAGVSAAAADGDATNQAGQMTVQASLTDGCTLNFDNSGSTVTVDFGQLADITSDLTKQKNFTVNCRTVGGKTATPVSVALDAGNVTGSKVSDRLLGTTTGPGTLHFQVYQGANGNTIWGDNSDGTNKSYLLPSASGTYPYHVTLNKQDVSGLPNGLYQNVMIATMTYTPAPAK